MVMNIYCKFKKASYNTFFVRTVTVKSLYTRGRGITRFHRYHSKVKLIGFGELSFWWIQFASVL